MPGGYLAEGWSAGSVGEGGLHRWAGLQRPEHGDRGDRRAGELRWDIRGDAGQPEHPDVEHLAGSPGCLEIVPAVVPQAEVEIPPGDGLLGRLRMALDLVADSGADKIGAVRIEAVLNQQIDMAQVDIAEVDGDLLGVAAGLGPQFVHVVGHSTIL